MLDKGLAVIEAIAVLKKIRGTGVTLLTVEHVMEAGRRP
jgi:hypothetical protein